MNDFVSVIMTVCKENLKYLKQSLNSIVNQDFDGEMEIIVIVDNPNYKYINDLYQILKSSKKNYSVIINKNNLGIVRSLNKGLKKARGQYILRMDADDISCRTRLKTQLAFLKANNLDFVASNIILIDLDGEVIKNFGTLKPLIGKKLERVERHLNIFWHPTWLFKRNIINKMGLYREIPSNEDYDFVIRAILKNFRLGMLGYALLKKRINPNSISVKDNYRQNILFMQIRKDFNKGRIFDLKRISKIINKSDQKRWNNEMLYFEKFRENGNFYYFIKLLKDSYGRYIIINSLKYKFLKAFFL